jgi:hypothetical protein
VIGPSVDGASDGDTTWRWRRGYVPHQPVRRVFARFAKVVILWSAAAVLLISEGYMSAAASCSSNTRS